MRTQISESCDCGAVVKADAYGLGVAEVVPVLVEAGCTSFYVSSLEEGLALQALLAPLKSVSACSIFVLTGCLPGEEKAFLDTGLTPVLVSLEMFQRWLLACRTYPEQASQTEAAIKVDTGMGRLGLGADEFERLLEAGESLSGARVKYLFSHLACADSPEHPLNALQLENFIKAKRRMEVWVPGLKTSFANSAGALLGRAFQFDFIRPGIALYGGQPSEAKRFPLQTVLTLVLPIIQVRQIPAGQSVGYGATRSWQSKRMIAVAKSGYADGLLRSLSNSGSGMLLPNVAEKGGVPHWVPMVGRVSMDTILFDVTDTPRPAQVGDAIEVLGTHNSLESLAQQAGTLNHEILTSLSGRYTRTYVKGE